MWAALLMILYLAFVISVLVVGLLVIYDLKAAGVPTGVNTTMLTYTEVGFYIIGSFIALGFLARLGGVSVYGGSKKKGSRR